MSNFTNRREEYLCKHPLKEVFRRRKIPLWCLRNYTGVPEPKLSRYLNNIDRMPFDVEKRLYQLVEILSGDLSSLGIEKTENVHTEPDTTLGEDNKK
jgi:hypothetical protein